MSSQSVNQLMFGARGGKGPLLAFLTKVLQLPRHIYRFVVWVKQPRRFMNTSNVQTPFGWGRCSCTLKVAQCFE